MYLNYIFLYKRKYIFIIALTQNIVLIDVNDLERASREYPSDMRIIYCITYLYQTRGLRLKINLKNLSPRILSRHAHGRNLRWDVDKRQTTISVQRRIEHLREIGTFFKFSAAERSYYRFKSDVHSFFFSYIDDDLFSVSLIFNVFGTCVLYERIATTYNSIRITCAYVCERFAIYRLLPPTYLVVIEIETSSKRWTRIIRRVWHRKINFTRNARDACNVI